MAVKPREGVRDEYAAHPDGADGWYRDHGATYRNPHEDAVGDVLALAVTWWPTAFTGRVLDLACGSGEATLALRAAGINAQDIDACDPYTAEAFQARVGRPIEPWSFADIADQLEARHAASANREPWPRAPFKGSENRRWDQNRVYKAYKARKRVPTPAG